VFGHNNFGHSHNLLDLSKAIVSRWSRSIHVIARYCTIYAIRFHVSTINPTSLIVTLSESFIFTVSPRKPVLKMIKIFSRKKSLSRRLISRDSNNIKINPPISKYVWSYHARLCTYLVQIYFFTVFIFNYMFLFSSYQIHDILYIYIYIKRNIYIYIYTHVYAR